MPCQFDYLFILPVLNESEVLEQSARALEQVLEKKLPSTNRWTIVIVDNGSNDATAAIARKLERASKRISFLSIRTAGRGNALRMAVKNFDAKIYMYSDIDLPFDLEEIDRLLMPIERSEADITIVKRIGVRPFFRRLFSFFFRAITFFLLKISVADPQAGAKVFSRKAAEFLQQCKEDGYFLDTEFLAVAQKNRVRICEIPVVWIEQRYANRKSKVRPFVDSVSAFHALIRIASRIT